MISRAWLALCVIAGQGLGFLTLTPPEEALENLQKWWKLVTPLFAGQGSGE
jgi:hypothetical protein